MASSPRICDTDCFSPLTTFGGVGGRKKLKTPNTRELILDIKKVFRKSPAARDSEVSQRNAKLISKPATIHPIVPHTLTALNSFEGSFICSKETELTRARVGINRTI